VNTRILPLVLVVVALTSCARAAAPGNGSPGSGSDGGVTSTQVPPGSSTPGPARPKIVTPSPGLADVRPISWTRAIPSGDGTVLTVRFWGSPCLSIDHVSLQETPSTVTVTLYQGTLPSMVGSACPEIAVLEAVQVRLASPLGDRTVVDGARSESPSPVETGGGRSSSPGSAA